MPIGYPGNSISKQARAKAGGGFESAIEVSGGAAGGTSALSWQAADGALTQGTELRLQTDGTYDFGTRPDAPAVWFYGDDHYIRGTKVALMENYADGQEILDNSVFKLGNGESYKPTFATRSRPWRHQYSQSHIYNDTAECLIGYFPTIYEELIGPDAPARIFVSYWMKYGINPRTGFLVKVISSEGVDTGSSDLAADGEKFTITETGATGTFAGVIVDPVAKTAMETGTYIVGQLDIADNSGAFQHPSNSTDGVTLVGDTSGLSVVTERANASTVPFNYGAQIGKCVRIYQEYNTKEINFVVGTLDVGASIRFEPTAGGFAYARDDSRPDPDLLPRSTANMISDPVPYPRYHNMVAFLDITKSDYVRDYGYSYYKKREYGSSYEQALATGAPVNADTVDDNTFVTVDRGHDTFAPTPINMGAEHSTNMLQTNDLGDVYIDRTPRRVVLGDASTWSAVRHTEIQRSKQWLSNDVRIAINWGELSSGNAWLYVLDDDDLVINEAGVAV